jgi:hypothetical protein
VPCGRARHEFAADPVLDGPHVSGPSCGGDSDVGTPAMYGRWCDLLAS